MSRLHIESILLLSNLVEKSYKKTKSYFRKSRMLYGAPPNAEEQPQQANISANAYGAPPAGGDNTEYQPQVTQPGCGSNLQQFQGQYQGYPPQGEHFPQEGMHFERGHPGNRGGHGNGPPGNFGGRGGHSLRGPPEGEFGGRGGRPQGLPEGHFGGRGGRHQEGPEGEFGGRGGHGGHRGGGRGGW